MDEIPQNLAKLLQLQMTPSKTFSHDCFWTELGNNNAGPFLHAHEAEQNIMTQLLKLHIPLMVLFNVFKIPEKRILFQRFTIHSNFKISLLIQMCVSVRLEQKLKLMDSGQRGRVMGFRNSKRQTFIIYPFAADLPSGENLHQWPLAPNSQPPPFSNSPLPDTFSLLPSLVCGPKCWKENKRNTMEQYLRSSELRLPFREQRRFLRQYSFYSFIVAQNQGRVKNILHSFFFIQEQIQGR